MKKSPKKSPKKSRVPLLLVAVAALIQEHHEDELIDALKAAREAMREYGRGEYPDSIHHFIDRYAEGKPYGNEVQKATDADIDLGALHNAYGTPALLAGMALAYIVLTNEGGAR